MRNLVGYARRLDRCDTVTASDDRDGRAVIGYSIRDLLGSLGEGLNFKDTHRSIPHDRASGADFSGKQFDGFRADVERHHVGGDRLPLADYLNASIWRDLVGHDMV